jgi:WD40 repeat protein
LLARGGSVWKRATGQEVLNRPGVGYASFSPDGQLLAVAYVGVSLYQIGTRRMLWEDTRGLAERQRAAFSVDGQTVAWGCRIGGSEGVMLRDTRTGKEVSRLPCPGPCWAVAFGPDGRTLAAAGENYIQFWDFLAKRLIRQLEQGPPEPRRLGFWPHRPIAFSPDGTLFAAASANNRIDLWDVATGRLLQPLSGHWGQLVSLEFAPDGKTLVSGSADTTALLWDLTALHVLK